MGQYAARRILQAIPLLFVVSMVVFGMLNLAPGGPMAAYERRAVGMSPQDIERMRQQLGLDDPVYIQYFRWLGQVVRGDLGQSLATRRPVTTEIRERLPRTALLMGSSFGFTLLIAIPFGVIAAVRQYSFFDHFVTTLAFIGQSIPQYWLGLIMIVIFYGMLDNPFGDGPMFPSGGMYTLGQDFSILDRLWHMVLPVTMLSLAWVAWYSRYLRASMLEVIHSDYVRTARAKGLREWVVIMRHAFRTAAIPLVTIIALDLPLIFAGALFTEVIFSWPGMGRLFYDAAERRDYHLLMAIIMITSFLIILSNLLADIVYGLLDPRIRYR
jgi:peptide/nickel transport system permease protein